MYLKCAVNQHPENLEYGHPYADGNAVGVGCLPGTQETATSPYGDTYADGIAVGVGILPDAQGWGRAVRSWLIRRRQGRRRSVPAERTGASHVDKYADGIAVGV